MSRPTNPDQDERDVNTDQELQRLRSLSLSDRPTSSSSASVLSLANAHAAAPVSGAAGAGGDGAADEATPTDAPDADALGAPKAGLPPVPARTQPADPVAEMRDRFSLGDYTGALAAAESLLAASPEHAEAKRCADNCRSVLEQMYAARIGPLDRIPHMAVPREKLQWLSIDHQAGFVLSHVDGVSSLQMIMAACGMPVLDVLRILHELVHSRVIAFR